MSVGSKEQDDQGWHPSFCLGKCVDDDVQKEAGEY